MNFSLKQTKIFALSIIVVASLFYFPELVHAQAETQNIFESLTNSFFGLILQLVQGILELCQGILLFVIKLTILEFSSVWSEGVLSTGLKSIWLIVRDIVNLFIVVFFLLTALLTIFGEFRFNRKILFGLLLAAIFVNFSAFFTLFALDVSHAIFIVFLSVLDIEILGSLSPFEGFDITLLDTTGNIWWNIMYTCIAIAVTFFIALGLLFFSIIFIERFIVAILLVIFSPFAVIGFFIEQFGSKVKMFSMFSKIYDMWRERFVFALTVPIILIFGLTIVLRIFSSILEKVVSDPNSTTTLQGPAGSDVLVGLIFASIILIFGIFKVGQFAKNTNIYQKFSRYGVNVIPKSYNVAKGVVRNLPYIRRIKPHNAQTEVSRKARAAGNVLSGVAGGIGSGKHVPFGREFDSKTGKVVADNTLGAKYHKEYSKIKSSEAIARDKGRSPIEKRIERERQQEGKKQDKQRLDERLLRRENREKEDSELLRETLKEIGNKSSNRDRKRGGGGQKPNYNNRNKNRRRNFDR